LLHSKGQGNGTFPHTFTSISNKTKAPVTTSPVVTGALFALSFTISLQTQRSPMNNRAHKKEKAKKQSKEYFANGAF
jgi:hypothetical protein